MSELVTGEAVVLGLQPARLPSRIVAVAIDLVVWWGTYLGVSLALFSATASLDSAAQAAVAVSSLLLCLVGLPVLVETLSRGRSLGKLVFGLRVVREDGGPIRFRHALVRGAVGAVEIQLSLGVIASVASLVSARGRRIGDVFAGTLVVRERVPAQSLQQPPPSPWMAAWMSGADLSGLSEDLWLAVRQYLSRMGQLDPRVSWDMGWRLAADVAERTGRAVPQGAPPAEYLAAVVAERQARDAQRVFGGGFGNGAVPGPGGAWPAAAPVVAPGRGPAWTGRPSGDRGWPGHAPVEGAGAAGGRGGSGEAAGPRGWASPASALDTAAGAGGPGWADGRAASGTPGARSTGGWSAAGGEPAALADLGGQAGPEGRLGAPDGQLGRRQGPRPEPGTTTGFAPPA
ncbi:RDD family protein [Wenjunlia vitaminophila]|uniref:RDD family protein n=1 Tax=Wenjunlia vitaminophila TaxID=76728 RepID=UPI00037AB7A1|nr:RDD family protein [Wenjunlia vitaminophila]